MSRRPVRAAAYPDPHSWRAGAVRVLVNVLLVLLAYFVVSMRAVAAEVILTGWSPPETPVEGMPFVLFAAVFFLVRWIYVLPGVLPVLVGIEYVARRAPHARVMTAVVSFAPMVLWELLVEPPHDFPSGQGVLLGLTAVLFALLARLPRRQPASSRATASAVGSAGHHSPSPGGQY